MDREEFISLTGGILRHVTLRRNLPGIMQAGLLRPSTLASLAGRPVDDILLRPDELTLLIANKPATLNYQRPLLAGRKQSDAFLDRHTLHSWAAQLDRRVFFWPGKANVAFEESLTDRGDVAVLSFSSGLMFDLFKEAMELAPINTGSATRRASRRGDWIYVPVTDDFEAFRLNRVRRKMTNTPDTIREVSIRADIAPFILPSVCADLKRPHSQSLTKPADPVIRG